MTALATNGDNLFIPDIDKILSSADGKGNGKAFDDWVKANFTKGSPLSVRGRAHVAHVYMSVAMTRHCTRRPMTLLQRERVARSA